MGLDFLKSLAGVSEMATVALMFYFGAFEVWGWARSNRSESEFSLWLGIPLLALSLTWGWFFFTQGFSFVSLIERH